MNDFFPNDNYKMPVTSNYMKFLEGDNTFRVLGSAIVGYEYFNTENKPVRQKEEFDTEPSDMKKDGRVVHFWAFVVWNYTARKVQILELTQKGIMATMQSYIKNEKWGDPKDYDITVSREGSGLETKYNVTVNPKEELEPAIVDKYKAMKIDLNALYSGDDPFASKE